MLDANIQTPFHTFEFVTVDLFSADVPCINTTESVDACVLCIVLLNS